MPRRKSQKKVIQALSAEPRFDYIVIGAGASGPIVASKAAAAGHSVLLLEMGRPVAATNQDIWDPTRWYKIIADPAYAMDFISAHQPGLGGQTRTLLQSAGTGGCQNHNAMVYVRGGRSTYDHWSTQGCTGWDYDSLIPNFAEIEAKMVTTASVEDEFSQGFLDAAKRVGLPFNPDYNGGGGEYGCVPFQFTIEETGEGLRRTTSYEKFVGATPPQTLMVATGCYVMKLVIEPGAPPAVLVLLPDGTAVTIQAEREVVLSAGAIMSPTLLLRSGIGPGKALDLLGIQIVADLEAVGENFHDDLGIGFPALCLTPPPPTPYGFLAAGAFTTSAGGRPPDPAPWGAVNLEMQLSTSNLPGAPNTPHCHLNYCLIGTSAMHLKSAGTVTLTSSDPAAPPHVDPNWLSHPDDMATCLAAFELCRNIAVDPALARQMQWIPFIPPDPALWIAATGTTVQHYVGSCSMGTDTGKSVVGPDLKVHGVPGLRVIDASVAPTTVTGNTAGVSMVIGSKGAELLLAS